MNLTFGGDIGGLFPLLALVPDALVVGEGNDKVSQDGAELISILSNDGAVFYPRVVYTVVFSNEDASAVSPLVKVYSRYKLVAVVPRLPEGVYDVTVAWGIYDETVMSEAVAVQKRGVFPLTHLARKGMPAPWDSGPSSAGEDDAEFSHGSNLAVFTGAVGEMATLLTGSTSEGITKTVDGYQRGDTTLAVASVYPFANVRYFSPRQGVVYKFESLDSGTNELVGVSILRGEDKDMPYGTLIYPVKGTE